MMPPSFSNPLKSLSLMVIIALIIPNIATTLGITSEGYCGILKKTPAPAITPHTKEIYKTVSIFTLLFNTMNHL